MSEQTKLDIAEAGAFAMILIIITALLLVEACMMPYLLRTLDFVSAALLASIATSVLMGIGYFSFKGIIRVVSDNIWRLKK